MTVQSLKSLEEEMRVLRVGDFSFKEAHAIGAYLVDAAKEQNLAVTIDVVVGAQQVFHYAFEGTDAENDDWIRRKRNVARYFGQSSYYVARWLADKGASLEAHKLSERDYAAFGGAFPICDKAGRILGVVTVSGLPDYLDHQLVVESLSWHRKTLPL